MKDEPMYYGGPVIRDPKPAIAPMKCRRGDGRPTQGQAPPPCDGIVEKRTHSGINEMSQCSKCRLTHGFVLGGEGQAPLLYGAVL